MKRSMKSKRVSWAPGVNLCQVALFRKEEYPSQVGLAGKHLQICRTYPDSFQSNDLPPGFEGTVSGFAGIPRIKWSCPPRFAVNPIWHVAAGEESREVEAQFLRESKVLESVYPYSSSIPSSPSVSVEAQAELYNDGLTPIIPIIPIEEIESYLPKTPLELPPSAPEAHEISEPEARAINPPPQRSTPLELAALAGSGPDVAAAASAAFTILNKSTEQQSMIDMNLLIKILSNPNLVGQLMNNPEGKSSSGKSNLTVSSPLPDIRVTKLGSPQAAGVPFYGTDLVRSPNPSRVPVPVPAPASTSCEIQVPKTGISFNGADKTTLAPTTASTPVTVLIPVSSGETVKQQPVKGIDYYKNLIRQHGGETQENMAQPYQNQNLLDNSNLHHQKLKPRETTLKRKHQQKQCVFYNSPKGCRNGTSCPFQHGSVPYQWQNGYFVDEPSMKRINLGSEIMGR